MTAYIQTNKAQHFCRILLGGFMILAAIGHLSFQRQEFQAQVPGWVPLGKDIIVILSGIVEMVLGVSMIVWKKERIRIGIALAVFYILIFPGNIAQYINRIDAFGLDSDNKRLTRLFFQPLLILWSLWSTGASKYLFTKNKMRK
jgi:uncharacterized membrane protein